MNPTSVKNIVWHGEKVQKAAQQVITWLKTEQKHGAYILQLVYFGAWITVKLQCESHMIYGTASKKKEKKDE